MRPTRVAKSAANDFIRNTTSKRKYTRKFPKMPKDKKSSPSEKNSNDNMKNSNNEVDENASPTLNNEIENTKSANATTRSTSPPPNNDKSDHENDYTDEKSDESESSDEGFTNKIPWVPDPTIEKEFKDILEFDDDATSDGTAESPNKSQLPITPAFTQQIEIPIPKPRIREPNSEIHPLDEWTSDTEDIGSLPTHPMNVPANIYRRTKSSFKNHDDRIKENREDINELSNAIVSYPNAIEALRVRQAELEKRVHESTFAVNTQVESNKRLASTVKQITTRQRKAITDLQDKFVKGMKHNKKRLDQHEETLSLNSAAILDLNSDVEILKKANTSTQIVTVVPRTLDTKMLKDMGIVFTDKELHHPYHFIHAFEANIDDTKIDPTTKCNLFRSLISVKGAEQWKQHNIRLQEYDELLAAFTAEFWSVDQQEAVLDYFLEDKADFNSTRELARYLLRWTETLDNMSNLDKQDIINHIVDKIAENKHRIVPPECRSSVKKLTSRLNEVQRTYRDTKKAKKLTVNVNKRLSSNEQKFTRYDYKASNKTSNDEKQRQYNDRASKNFTNNRPYDPRRNFDKSNDFKKPHNSGKTPNEPPTNKAKPTYEKQQTYEKLRKETEVNNVEISEDANDVIHEERYEESDSSTQESPRPSSPENDEGED